MNTAKCRLSLTEGVQALAVASAAAAFSLVEGRLIADPVGLRLALGGAAIAVVGAVGFRSPRSLLYGLILWLPALGLIRRLALQVQPAPRHDPLLLVAPLALIVLFLVSVRGSPFPKRTAVAKGMLALGVFVLCGAVNPLQGSPLAGVGGLLFVGVPLLAFWIGKRFCDDAMFARLLKVTAIAGVAAAAYGLFQTLHGFPSWDRHWIAVSGYGALNVGGTVRAFGSLTSGSEYALLVSVAFVIVAVFWLRRSGWALIALAALGTAIVLESSRGAVVMSLLALAVVASARVGLSMRSAALVGGVALFALSFAASHLLGATSASAGTSGLVSHQVRGLANPLDAKSSTLPVHLKLVEQGIKTAITEPVGLGIGAVTIASDKFGGRSAGTEADPSNAAVALGLPGLIAYLVVFVAGMRAAFDVARRRRDSLSLIALGILVVTLLQWLNGGNYAVALLPWLALGWLDRQLDRSHPDSDLERSPA